MSVEAVRESTDAELDARMLAYIREWRLGRYQSWPTDSVSIGIEELDMLLRIADERDTLRREVCAEPPDPKYVIRKCADCHHEPHGIRMLCINRFCACRNERPTQ